MSNRGTFGTGQLASGDPAVIGPNEKVFDQKGKIMVCADHEHLARRSGAHHTSARDAAD